MTKTNGNASLIENPRVRFAPSPTGHLHLGTARTAVFNWLFARRYGGTLVLRIEDTDVERSKSGYERSIVEDLHWLGIEWEEGPDIGGPYGPYRQSERLQGYRDIARDLEARGLAYPCYCTPDELEASRQEMLAAGRMPMYNGRCLRLSTAERAGLAASRRAALRFRVPEGAVVVHDMLRGDITFSSQVIGDFVILRSDGSPAYNFAAIVDDSAMKITHVIRGEDHLSNSARQILLYEAVGAKAPALLHLGIVLGPDGHKLSKRHGAKSIGDYRNEGYLPQAVLNYLAILGWSDPEGEEVFAPGDLVRCFAWERISRNPVIFDEAKLKWLDGRHIRGLDPAQLAELAAPGLSCAGLWHERPVQWWELLIQAVHDSITTFADIEPYARMFIADLEYPEEAHDVFKEPLAQRGLRELLARSESNRDLESVDDWRRLLAEVKHEFKGQGASPGKLLPPVRLALTGTTSGPELPYCLALLGREGVIRRLKAALALAREG